MVNKFLQYSQSLLENLPGICRPTVFPGTFTAGTGYTPFFAVNAPPGSSIDGLYYEAVATMVASATCASTTGTDVMDLIGAGYNVSDAPNADARCRTVSRLGMEEIERLLVNPGSGGLATGNMNFLKYPRASAGALATGTTTTYVQGVIPCGEPTDAVQLQFKLPGANTIYSSGVTSLTIQYTVYPIPSPNPAAVAFVESPLPSYASSALVPIEQYQPTNISPDLADFVGFAASTFNTISAYDTKGNEIVNMLTSSTVYANQYAYPNVAASSASTFVNLRGNRVSRFVANLAASAALDVLWIQLSGQPEAGPTEGHDQTPSPPATAKVAKSVPGTIGATPAGGSSSGQPARGWGRRVA